jgi:hypothetical protein
MLILRSFLAVLLSILRSSAALELENLALRHQIGVLQRSAARRPTTVQQVRTRFYYGKLALATRKHFW